MDTILAVIIIAILLVLSISALGGALIQSQDLLVEGWQGARQVAAEQDATSIRIISADVISDRIQVVLENDGSCALAQFARWDVILSASSAAEGYSVTWVPFDEANAEGYYWENAGLYMDAGQDTAEVFGPEVFDPGEQLLLLVYLPDPVASDVAIGIDVVTDGGGQASTVFIDG